MMTLKVCALASLVLPGSSQSRDSGAFLGSQHDDTATPAPTAEPELDWKSFVGLYLDTNMTPTLELVENTYMGEVIFTFRSEGWPSEIKQGKVRFHLDTSPSETTADSNNSDCSVHWTSSSNSKNTQVMKLEFEDLDHIEKEPCSFNREERPVAEITGFVTAFLMIDPFGLEPMEITAWRWSVMMTVTDTAVASFGLNVFGAYNGSFLPPSLPGLPVDNDARKPGQPGPSCKKGTLGKNEYSSDTPCIVPGVKVVDLVYPSKLVVYDDETFQAEKKVHLYQVGDMMYIKHVLDGECNLNLKLMDVHLSTMLKDAGGPSKRLNLTVEATMLKEAQKFIHFKVPLTRYCPKCLLHVGSDVVGTPRRLESRSPIAPLYHKENPSGSIDIQMIAPVEVGFAAELEGLNYDLCTDPEMEAKLRATMQDTITEEVNTVNEMTAVYVKPLSRYGNIEATIGIGSTDEAAEMRDHLAKSESLHVAMLAIAKAALDGAAHPSLVITDVGVVEEPQMESKIAQPVGADECDPMMTVSNALATCGVAQARSCCPVQYAAKLVAGSAAQCQPCLANPGAMLHMGSCLIETICVTLAIMATICGCVYKVVGQSKRWQWWQSLQAAPQGPGEARTLAKWHQPRRDAEAGSLLAANE